MALTPSTVPNLIIKMNYWVIKSQIMSWIQEQISYMDIKVSFWANFDQHNYYQLWKIYELASSWYRKSSFWHVLLLRLFNLEPFWSTFGRQNRCLISRAQIGENELIIKSLQNSPGQAAFYFVIIMGQNKACKPKKHPKFAGA